MILIINLSLIMKVIEKFADAEFEEYEIEGDADYSASENGVTNVNKCTMILGIYEVRIKCEF